MSNNIAKLDKGFYSLFSLFSKHDLWPPRSNFTNKAFLKALTCLFVNACVFVAMESSQLWWYLQCVSKYIFVLMYVWVWIYEYILCTLKCIIKPKKYPSLLAHMRVFVCWCIKHCKTVFCVFVRVYAGFCLYALQKERLIIKVWRRDRCHKLCVWLCVCLYVYCMCVCVCMYHR